MADILRLCVIFCLILLLLRKKVNVGIALIIASVCLAAMYLFSVQKSIQTLRDVITDSNTIKLLLSLSLIRCLEMVLREKEALSRMMQDVKALIRSKKLVIISMPVIIGMLPSLGGAYFSAPMVDETTKDTKLPQEEKAFINYWFRHVWEMILPLYPGLLVASALSSIEIRTLVLYNMPIVVMMILSGFLLSMRGIRNAPAEIASSIGRRQVMNAIVSFLPIASILTLVMLLNVELYLALAIVLFILLLRYRSKPADLLRIFRYGFHRDVFVLILGTMLFKSVLEVSGAVHSISFYFNQKGLPLLPVLIILPFITGMLTGITVAYVGSSFPLLISLAGGVHLNDIMLAMISGFAGVLMSPVHLCLILTREYFKADIARFYHRVFYGTSIIMSGALALYFTV